MTEQELEKRRKRFAVIHKALIKLFPNAVIALKYKTPWELLVAVQLSAQCTDKKVNEVTIPLFKKYRKLDDYVNADPREFEKDIYQTGFYRNKAKNILAAAKLIKEQYKGKLPKTMAEMVKVPGMGRKSANVVLGNAYGVVEGIAIDTHMIRLSRVFGLTKETTPEKIEQDLMKIIPRKDWFVSTYRIIDYGRAYCHAKPHKHDQCPLTKVLQKYEKKK